MSDAIKNLCPVCKAEITDFSKACPRCGFMLLGKTEKFRPVGADEQKPAAEVSTKKAVLRIEKGAYAGEHFELGQGKFKIGRDPECDLFLNNMTVSREHAIITVNGEDAEIVDNSSLNGTWVDGSIIDQVPLHVGSHIQIGTFEMIFDYTDSVD